PGCAAARRAARAGGGASDLAGALAGTEAGGPARARAFAGGYAARALAGLGEGFTRGWRVFRGVAGDAGAVPAHSSRRRAPGRAGAGGATHRRADALPGVRRGLRAGSRRYAAL